MKQASRRPQEEQSPSLAAAAPAPAGQVALRLIVISRALRKP